MARRSRSRPRDETRGSAYICMYLRGALQICPKPLEYQLTEMVLTPLEATAATSSYHSVVWFARVALWTGLLTTLYARSANQQWVYKPVKERPRFWSEAAALEQGRRREGVFVLNSVNSFWQIRPQRGC